jgi:tetratricopeptide (TPR) repeat protein
MQFVIEPINAPDELRPYADAFVANIADELSDGEWDVVLPGSQQSQKEPPAGYRFAVHAFGTGDTAHLSYQVKDVFSGEVVTSEVLPFGVHSDVVAASTQLIRKIRVELGRSHRVFGNLSRSERSAWETLVRQHSLADSLRNAGDFGAAARAYGVLDSLYTMQRWGARVALMFGVERLRGRRASVFSESMRGNTDLDSLINEAERMAADLIDRFPNRFEAREARGLVRHQRVLLGKTKSLLALIDSAVADLQPPTADKGSPEGLTALSGLLLNRGDWAAARTYALAALKRDNFLEHENANLMQLYVASFNLGEDDLARRACKEINANFPRQNIGVACRLELMGWSDTEPLDLAEARRIAREGNANDPPYLRAHTEKEANLLLAAIMFRAGEIAEAHELANSVDVSTDTNTGLLGQKAAVLARFGDSTRARELAAGDALHGVLTQIALEKMRVYKGLLPKH